jgi:DNA (cytosine-5)-methyltransferase 1
MGGLGMMVIKFTDWCCGIGGTRTAIVQAAKEEGFDAECVLSSDNDKFCKISYKENYGEDVIDGPRGVDPSLVPAHDMFSAGFPCQPFSIAGVSKKLSLGRKHGFADKVSGTVFFELAKLIERSQPEAVFLENVKNLASHNKGKTLETIISVLRDDLGYFVVEPARIFDAANLVPQHRERLFIIAFKKERDRNRFSWPKVVDHKPKLRDILEKDVDPKYTLSDKLWKGLQRHAENSRKKGNGFGFGLSDINGVSRTLSARYYKDGSEILIPQKNKNPRRLTPRECARLQGFPESFRIVVSDTQAYKQFGNSVPIPLLKLVAKQIIKALKD